MQTEAILQEIYHLPVVEQMIILEHVTRAVRAKSALDMELSAALMVDEYRNNKELTIFTQLDSEDFYDYETN